MVKRLVDASDGRIQVKSAPHEGTTVTILLPTVPTPAATPAEKRPSDRPAAAAGGQRILVVEDDPQVRSLLGTVLLAARYWVMVARDGHEAIAFIEQEAQPFDLIVTDLMMPGMGGLALAERLRGKGIAARLLFVSAYSDHTPADLERYGELLPKPFTPWHLLERVARVLAD
jgi:CheY-like chemotaxis protein